MKKKILIILPYVPYPLVSGGQIAVFGMIDYLRTRFDLSLVMPFSNAVADLEKAWPDLTIYTHKQSLRNKISVRLLKYIFEAFISFYVSFLRARKINSHSYHVYFFDINKKLISLVNDLLSKNKYDFVQVEFYEYLPLICFLPPELNTIFIHHELRYIRNERTEQERGTESVLKSFLLAQNKGQEIQFLKMYSKIVTVSDIDKQLLAKDINPVKLFSSPLAIKSNKDLRINYTFENKIFLLGGSSHWPNVSGLEWFMANCWPIISSENKDLKLIIIGDWSESNMKPFKAPRVNFLGFVDELQEVFNNGILVVPLKVGSGMRMKIIDAVNYNIPFVTTEVGIEGLNFKDSEECFIANEPAEFSRKLLQLVNSEKLQHEFIKKSKLVLDENYGYEKLVKIREQIYL